jgi:hypothetical protein
MPDNLCQSSSVKAAERVGRDFWGWSGPSVELLLLTIGGAKR